jgi:hypothetical protein
MATTSILSDNNSPHNKNNFDLTIRIDSLTAGVFICGPMSGECTKR